MVWGFGVGFVLVFEDVDGLFGVVLLGWEEGGWGWEVRRGCCCWEVKLLDMVCGVDELGELERLKVVFVYLVDLVVEWLGVNLWWYDIWCVVWCFELSWRIGCLIIGVLLFYEGESCCKGLEY